MNTHSLPCLPLRLMAIVLPLALTACAAEPGGSCASGVELPKALVGPYSKW